MAEARTLPDAPSKNVMGEIRGGERPVDELHRGGVDDEVVAAVMRMLGCRGAAGHEEG